MKYMRDGLDDSFGILRLQDKILEIALYLDNFCTENGIDYCLMGGSALGAKRHGGFIPWDDDLDVFMTPDNYEKFRAAFNESGDKDKFYLQEYGRTKKGLVTIPKLRMNGTAYIEELLQDKKVHQGIYVDIFILHVCPDSKFWRRWQYFWAKCAVVKGISMRGYNRQKGLKMLPVHLAKIMPRKLMLDFALAQVYRWRNCRTENFCNFLGKARFKNGLYKREWFSETEYAPFEKVSLRVPKGLHEFLTERFGDYMVPPSMESIRREQHASQWDTEKDFSEFVNKDRDFSDEIYLA